MNNENKHKIQNATVSIRKYLLLQYTMNHLVSMASVKKSLFAILQQRKHCTIGVEKHCLLIQRISNAFSIIEHFS